MKVGDALPMPDSIESERLRDKLERAADLLRRTLAAHDTGHSPCCCVEIKAFLEGPW